jgi:hypothetical protein
LCLGRVVAFVVCVKPQMGRNEAGDECAKLIEGLCAVQE